VFVKQVGFMDIFSIDTKSSRRVACRQKNIALGKIMNYSLLLIPKMPMQQFVSRFVNL